MPASSGVDYLSLIAFRRLAKPANNVTIKIVAITGKTRQKPHRRKHDYIRHRTRILPIRLWLLEPMALSLACQISDQRRQINIGITHSAWAQSASGEKYK